MYNLHHQDMNSDNNPPEITCEEVRDQMFLLATNDLDDAEAFTAYTHLAGCAECRKAMAEHVKLAAALFGTLGHDKN